MAQLSNSPEDGSEADRRKFLATCGKFAVVTPPAITLLLSTSLHSSAIAGSAGGIGGSNGRGGSHPNNGGGNGGGDGIPNPQNEKFTDYGR
jgi:hypothetical protein